MTELPEDRRKSVEAGLTAYHATQAEIEHLQSELRDAHVTIEGLRAQLKSLDDLHGLHESRIASHQLERDQAVADRAKYETLFASMFAMMQTFDVPVETLVKSKEIRGEQSSSQSAGGDRPEYRDVSREGRDEPQARAGLVAEGQPGNREAAES